MCVGMLHSHIVYFQTRNKILFEYTQNKLVNKKIYKNVHLLHRKLRKRVVVISKVQQKIQH